MIVLTASLDDTLRTVADYLKLDAAQLCAYAAEDSHTGWDFGKGAWMCGSLHRPEGQTLYALVRALRPTHVLELGALEGCSTTHIAQALAANGAGRLTSVDINPAFGAGVPEALRPYVEHTVGWADAVLEAWHGELDMVYEDTDHSESVTRDLWQRAIPKMKAGGVLVSHDPFSDSVGKPVIAGISGALGHDDFLMVQVPPSDCGLALWVKP